MAIISFQQCQKLLLHPSLKTRFLLPSLFPQAYCSPVGWPLPLQTSTSISLALTKTIGSSRTPMTFRSCTRTFPHIVSGKTKLYNASARQFKLLCQAHSHQLDFMLEQIKMAPSRCKNFFMYLEDYVQKERNLRMLLRKIS